MANLIVFIELDNGHPTAPSRFAAAEARRVADVFGATVYALVAGPLEGGALEDLAGTLGRTGADKVLACADPAFAGPPVDAIFGEAIALVATKLRPMLFLFPAGGVGLQLGPPLALRLGAVYFPEAVMGVADAEGDEPRLLLARAPTGAGGRRLIDFADCERAAVVVLPAGSVSEGRGAAAELDVLAAPCPKAPPITELTAEPDPTAPVARASTLIVLPSDRDAQALGAAPVGEAADAPPAAFRIDENGTVAVAESTLRAAPGRTLGACPAHVLWLADAPATLAAVRAAPGSTVAVLGSPGAPAPAPIVNVVWTVSAEQALTALGEELRRAPRSGKRADADEPATERSELSR